MHRLLRRSRAANSIVSGGIWPKFELMQAFVHCLVTCKNEENPFKNLRGLEWSQHISHFKSIGIIEMLNGSELRSLWLDLADFRSRLRFYGCLHYLQALKDPIKMKVLEWSQHYTSIFQTLMCSLLRGQFWSLAKIRTHPSFCPCICKKEEDPFKN